MARTLHDEVRTEVIMPCMGEALDVYVASDHNGTAARNHVIQVLQEIGRERDLVATDLGPDEYEGKVDYPDMAQKLALKMKPDGNWQWCHGILICGTGSGMEIAANRFPWIRAAIATDKVTAKLMRQHNDANVLVLGQWRTPLGQMEEIIRAYLETSFEGGRHIPRIEKLSKLPNG
ncbi:MAG: RpiB/LacA/LacB family sugar-phosphate isomerase [Acidiferrobacterales bacterium]